MAAISFHPVRAESNFYGAAREPADSIVVARTGRARPGSGSGLLINRATRAAARQSAWLVPDEHSLAYEEIPRSRGHRRLSRRAHRVSRHSMRAKDAK